MGRPDTWDRLARLEQCCEVSIRGYSTPGAPRWVVRIAPREPGKRPISAAGSTLPEALSDALAQADALGWIPTH